jgi:hypothetical protein
MKPMGIASFLVTMLVLATSILWFPTLMDIVSDCLVDVGVGVPDWLLDFVVALPYIVLSVILLISVVRLSKRGQRPEDLER